MSTSTGKQAPKRSLRDGRGTKAGRRSTKQPPRRGAGPQAHGAGPDDHLQIYGLHAVSAALQNPQRTIRALYATANAERRLVALTGFAPLAPPPPTTVLPKDLDRRLGADTVHQGILAECDPLPDVALEALVEQTLASGKPLIVLDQVTDPHNVGAVLRSAAAFGASGLVMTRRHSPPLAGALAKAASGALETMPVALVQNLAQAIETLKQLGCAVLGLEGSAAVTLEDALGPAPVALVLGAEGKGLRQSTRSGCTDLCAIATDGPISSLNISNAAAVALYLHAMNRRGRLPSASSVVSSAVD